MRKLSSARPSGVTAGGKLRRAAIFLLVAGIVAGGVLLLLPRREGKTPPPASPVAPTADPPAKPAPAAVAETPAPALPEARANTPVPADDPEVVTVQDAVPAVPPPAQTDAPDAKPATPKPATPVRKGVPHPDDPADEEPYVAPDTLEESVFSSEMNAIRALAGNDGNATAVRRIRELLKKTAFASAQYREGAKLLNAAVRAEKAAPEDAEIYTVRPGDSLIRLARRFRISTVRLAAENGLEADARLKIGRKLRVPKPAAPWSVRVSKRARLLRVWRGDELFAVYDAGIGRRDLTPEGVFVVREILDDPPYPKPEGGMAPAGSPENQLGKCWIGLGDRRNRATGYGIHGTPDETSVTKNLSAGCIRLRNGDVRELRSRIPAGTAVVIEK